jgi:hypothetical protein
MKCLQHAAMNGRSSEQAAGQIRSPYGQAERFTCYDTSFVETSVTWRTHDGQRLPNRSVEKIKSITSIMGEAWVSLLASFKCDCRGMLLARDDTFPFTCNLLPSALPHLGQQLNFSLLLFHNFDLNR